ncbi:STAS domain-containing protein [Gracilibacillus xinjiangensis]|uniref:STAS domain-containing protein n=1 Tax=Gracilibacillus xinjiangensis TaxID=1193282 RepID=A0ABV8WPE1_9BACI
MEVTIKLSRELKGDSCILRVGGVLDYSTIEPFTEEVRSIKQGIKKVSIDFRGLEFIDSTGIGAIINLVHEANSKQFEVELEGISSDTREVFETIGVFQIMETLQRESE